MVFLDQPHSFWSGYRSPRALREEDPEQETPWGLIQGRRLRWHCSHCHMRCQFVHSAHLGRHNLSMEQRSNHCLARRGGRPHPRLHHL